MIAEKCVNITGHDSNFNIQPNFDYITILTNSSSYRYTGHDTPRGIGSTSAQLIGIKSGKVMSISFFR